MLGFVQLGSAALSLYHTLTYAGAASSTTAIKRKTGSCLLLAYLLVEKIDKTI